MLCWKFVTNKNQLHVFFIKLPDLHVKAFDIQNQMFRLHFEKIIRIFSKIKSVLERLSIVFLFYKCSRSEVNVFSLHCSSAGNSWHDKPEFERGLGILHKNIFIIGILVYICYNEKQGSNPTLLFIGSRNFEPPD